MKAKTPEEKLLADYLELLYRLEEAMVLPKEEAMPIKEIVGTIDIGGSILAISHLGNAQKA